MKLGINKIFIYDNNDVKGENFDDIINNYIKNKYVEIIDVRGLSSIQIPVYNHCYRKNKDICDWIGFLDFDEFLYIKNNENIRNYLYDEKFNKCQLIFFNWVIYDDNDLINYDNRKLIDRFTHPKLKYYQGKSFIRGNINNLVVPTTHIPGINVFNFCNSNGKFIHPRNFIGNKFEESSKAYIKHFYTKTAEEFCRKVNKGHAHFHKDHPKYINSINLRLNLFFKINKVTQEKIKIIEKCLNMKLNRFKKFF